MSRSFDATESSWWKRHQPNIAIGVYDARKLPGSAASATLGIKGARATMLLLACTLTRAASPNVVTASGSGKPVMSFAQFIIVRQLKRSVTQDSNVQATRVSQFKELSPLNRTSKLSRALVGVRWRFARNENQEIETRRESAVDSRAARV